MTVTGERRCWNEKLQVKKNDYRRVSPGSWFGPRFSTTPLLIAYRLNCMIPTFSVETKSCTTQQELSQSGVSAPTCETFEIAVSSYTYPSHTRAHTHTITQPLLHNVDSEGGEFWLGCIQSCHPRDLREIWIRKDSVVPIWSSCFAGQQGLLLRPAFQRPVRRGALHMWAESAETQITSHYSSAAACTHVPDSTHTY